MIDLREMRRQGLSGAVVLCTDLCPIDLRPPLVLSFNDQTGSLEWRAAEEMQAMCQEAGEPLKLLCRNNLRHWHKRLKDLSMLRLPNWQINPPRGKPAAGAIR
jgi:hypothetical protein